MSFICQWLFHIFVDFIHKPLELSPKRVYIISTNIQYNFSTILLQVGLAKLPNLMALGSLMRLLGAFYGVLRRMLGLELVEFGMNGGFAGVGDRGGTVLGFAVAE